MVIDERSVRTPPPSADATSTIAEDFIASQQISAFFVAGAASG